MTNMLHKRNLNNIQWTHMYQCLSQQDMHTALELFDHLHLETVPLLCFDVLSYTNNTMLTFLKLASNGTVADNLQAKCMHNQLDNHGYHQRNYQNDILDMLYLHQMKVLKLS